MLVNGFALYSVSMFLELFSYCPSCCSFTEPLFGVVVLRLRIWSVTLGVLVTVGLNLPTCFFFNISTCSPGQGSLKLSCLESTFLFANEC